MLKIQLFIVIILLYFNYSSQAQSKITIKGNISDDYGKPLELVNVKISGTNIGSVSNLNGNFNFNYSGKSPSILVSRILALLEKIPASFFYQVKTCTWK